MSDLVPFDTLAYAQKLEEGGVPSDQSKVHSQELANILTNFDKNTWPIFRKRGIGSIFDECTIYIGILLLFEILLLILIVKGS